MATQQHTGAALRVRVGGVEHTTRYTGSRDQLLAAGVIGPDTPMPGDPGQRRGFLRLPDNPRRILTIKPASAGRFTVEVRLPDDEIERRNAAQAARRAALDAEHHKQVQAQAATAVLDGAPKSFDAFRSRVGSIAAITLEVLESACRGAAGVGYRFSDPVSDEIAAHLSRVRALLEHGTVEFRRDECDAQRARLHAVAARGDARFSRFLVAAKAR
jgi:hypothetical protein